MDRTTLRNILVDLFNDSELHDLCFDLHIDYERLEGADKAAKARELFLYCERHDRLPELESLCRRLRPTAFEQPLPSDGLPKQSIPHNLPPRSEFVGREKEKAQIHEALCSRSYLISIDGIGGIGKSSLALEVVYECLDAGRDKSGQNVAIFDGFIWTTARDRDLSLNAMLDTIARTLDYPGIVQQPLEEKRHAVCKLLQSRRYLLIVDNFGTISDEGIRDFLLDLPEPSKVLITTREQKLPQVRPVSIKGLTEVEALALIRGEGRRLGLASFEQAEDRILGRLYQATGGAPLAIKWAVGQIKQKGQSLDAVLAALHEARGDIFEQVFTRSWNFLTPDTQQVLSVMPLFATSATCSAIEAASDLHSFAFDEALGQLVEMSLVEATDELEQANRRYSLHPLARSFAAARLRQREIFEIASRLRIAVFFEGLCRQYRRDWYQEGYSRLSPELPNIMAMVEWCWQQPKHIMLGLSIFHSITGFMCSAGYWNDALSMGYRAVAMATQVGEEYIAAGFRLWSIAWVYRHRRQQNMAEEQILLALAVFERCGTKKDLAYAKRCLGRVAQQRGDFERASKLLEEATAIYEEIEDPDGLLACKIILAGLKLQQGDLDAAWTLSESTIEPGRRRGHKEFSAWDIMGDVAYRRGDLEKARLLWEESLRQYKGLKSVEGTAGALVNLAHIEAEMNRKQSAQQMLSEALEIYKKLGAESRAHEVEEFLAKLSETTSQPPAEEPRP